MDKNPKRLRVLLFKCAKIGFNMTKVITRFPPSPTGYFHIGSARTALFQYLFAKHHDGEMILRIEDTDKERSKKEYEEDIVESLDWLGIKYSGEITRQSERTEIYKKYLKELVDSNKAYFSEEKEGQNKEVIRFRNPNTQIKFQDQIRGEVKFDTSDLGDFVIAKSLDEPLYHLTVVVDDHEMNVTHILRGEDHISNTPRQILIQDAFGFERPQYAHIPLVLAPDRSKLSKRNSVVSIREYRKMGYMSEAIINFLALLGWNPGDEREIFTMEELIKEFSLEKVNKGGAIFNIEKLDWVNKKHLEKLSDEEFLSGAGEYIPDDLKNYVNFDKVLPLIRERVSKFGDVISLIDDGEFDFILNEPEVVAEKLIWKDEGRQITKENLDEVLMRLEKVDEFSRDNVVSAIQPFADEKGRGSVMHPMRLALTGKDRSPDPFTVASIIGKEETIKRLKKSIKILS
jgi:glutamyl-tRNA synthetase